MKELNWVAIQRQRYYVGLDPIGDGSETSKKMILGIIWNVGVEHGLRGPEDTTGQRWYGNALRSDNTYTSYGEISDFSEVRALVEGDL